MSKAANISTSLRSATTRSHIVLYHPDESIRQTLTSDFVPSMVDVSSIPEGQTALQILKSGAVDVAILTSGGDGTYSGFDILRQVRTMPETENIPVLILAEGADYERIVSLELGADDCILYPFNHREVWLRVRSLLKRINRESRPSPTNLPIIATDEFYFNPAALDVRVLGKAIHLTGTEFRLLMQLVTRLDVVVDRKLLAETLGHNPNSPASLYTINTQIRRLRNKLGPIGNYLQSIRGIGYRFSCKMANLR